MSISDGPWHASAPHAGGIVITNAQGRVVAAGVPNADDAAFICEARAALAIPVSVEIDWRAFGAAVAAARKKHHVSQDEAAQICGISRNYFSQIELGKAAPSYTIVLTLCRWLSLDMPQ